MSIDLSPTNELGFHTEPLTRTAKGMLSIRNPNSSAIAYKVKSSAAQSYVVSSTFGRIPAGQSLKIIVEREAMQQEPLPNITCGDQFLIQSALIPDECMNLKDDQLWLEIDRVQVKTIYRHTLNVAFLTPQTNDIPQTSEEGPSESPLAIAANNEVLEDLPPPAYSLLFPSSQEQPEQQPVQQSSRQEQPRQDPPLDSEQGARTRSATSVPTPIETMDVVEYGITITNNEDNANDARRVSVSIPTAQSRVQDVPLPIVNPGSPTEIGTVADHDFNSNRDSNNNDDGVRVYVSTLSTQAPVQSVPMSDADSDLAVLHDKMATMMCNIREMENTVEQLRQRIIAVSPHYKNFDSDLGLSPPVAVNAHLNSQRVFPAIYVVGAALVSFIVGLLFF